MKEIKTSILIQATAAEVWQAIIDFEKYPDWNPFIRKITGQPKIGSKLEAKILPPGFSLQTFKPVVKVVDENREFRWLGNIGISGLFDGAHYFQIEEVGENQVRFIHGEQFRGILVRPIMAMIGKATEAGFTAMNEALKNYLENNQTLKS